MSERERVLLNLIANSWFSRLYYDPLLHMTEDFFIKKLLYFFFDKIWCLERNFFSFNFLLHFKDETLSKKTKGIFFRGRKVKKTQLCNTKGNKDTNHNRLISMTSSDDSQF